LCDRLVCRAETQYASDVADLVEGVGQSGFGEAPKCRQRDLSQGVLLKAHANLAAAGELASDIDVASQFVMQDCRLGFGPEAGRLLDTVAGGQVEGQGGGESGQQAGDQDAQGGQDPDVPVHPADSMSDARRVAWTHGWPIGRGAVMCSWPQYT